MSVDTPLTTEQQLAYAIALQRKHTDELGFLSTTAMSEYADRGQLLIQTEQGDPAAYAIFYTGRNSHRPRLNPGTLRIMQICTQYDARHIYHATALVHRIRLIARDRGFDAIRAWVADDIPANAFWQAIGFTQVDTRQGGRRRKRRHNLWRFDVTPTLFDRPFISLHEL